MTNDGGENAVDYRAGKHVGHKIPGRNTPTGYYNKLARARPRSDVVMIISRPRRFRARYDVYDLRGSRVVDGVNKKNVPVRLTKRHFFFSRKRQQLLFNTPLVCDTATTVTTTERRLENT